ncbi:MAG TPA: GTPase Era [bacterium]|nr:GTPase Era [bacterium]
MAETRDASPVPKSPTPSPGPGGPGHRSGFVAVVGRPNVGKSALVNRLVGQKVAITATVPQTTRSRVAGILTRPDVQIVLIDTPGLHQPQHRLGEWMVDQALRALGDADVVLFVLDAARGVTPEDEQVAARLPTSGPPVVAVLNKADRADAGSLKGMEARVRSLRGVAGVYAVSAATGANLDHLVDLVVGLLPEGPEYFPPEMFTDQPQQFLVRELVREQAISLTREELPHSIAVEIEEFTERSPASARGGTKGGGPPLIYIRAVLHVERESHKKMLIGRDGRMLKAIGQRSRREIEALLGSRIFLELWVKTTKDWRERDDLIKAFYPE